MNNTKCNYCLCIETLTDYSFRFGFITKNVIDEFYSVFDNKKYMTFMDFSTINQVLPLFILPYVFSCFPRELTG